MPRRHFGLRKRVLDEISVFVLVCTSINFVSYMSVQLVNMHRLPQGMLVCCCWESSVTAGYSYTSKGMRMCIFTVLNLCKSQVMTSKIPV